MSQNTVTVNIANKSLKIACPLGEESALLAAAHDLSARFKDTQTKAQTNSSTEQTMMMTALNLAYDLQKEKEASDKEKLALQSKIELLQSTIEQALSSPSSTINQARDKAS